MRMHFDDILGGFCVVMMAVGCAALVAVIAYSVYQEVYHPCVKSHPELVPSKTTRNQSLKNEAQKIPYSKE